MSEYLFELDANKQDFNLYMSHRLISEASVLSNTPSELLTIIGRVIHVDKLRLQIAYTPNPHSLVESIFTNPLMRVQGYFPSKDIPADEVRIETDEGVCRVYNLNHSY